MEKPRIYRYAAVAVLYEPDHKVIFNIMSYSRYLEKVYVIDNTEFMDTELVQKIKGLRNVQYIWNHGNLGLAVALNMGCQKAFSDGYPYVFTMDQDSVMQSGTVERMKAFMESSSDRTVVAPFVIPYFDTVSPWNKKKTDKSQVVNFAITSGMLVSKEAFEDVGGFDDKLFIECIDVDFCIKLKQKSWKIIKIENAVLYQRAGNSEPKKFLWKTVHPLFEAPYRGYYKFRNKKYLKNKYGKKIYQFTPRLYEAVVKTLLYEPNKMVRFHYYLKGYRDGMRKQMGKI